MLCFNKLESQSSEEVENDNITFMNMANEIKEETEERFKAHVQKYQADGFTLKQAKEEAEMVMLSGDRQMMYKKYLTFLKTLFTFRKSELHRSIVRDIKAEMDKLYDPTKAIRNILRKRKLCSTVVLKKNPAGVVLGRFFYFLVSRTWLFQNWGRREEKKSK